MSNPFKVGDKITVAAVTIWSSHCARDTTAEKHYTVRAVGLSSLSSDPTKLDVSFTDDVGNTVTLHVEDVTLVEE